MSPQPVPVQATGVKLTPGYGAEGPKREAALRVWRIRKGLLSRKALGHESWQDYISMQYGVSAFPVLTREKRTELVAELADTMSTRAVAVVLGVSQSTVQRAITAGESNDSAEPADETEPEIGAKVSLVPPKVKSLDDKQHPKHKKGSRKTGQPSTEEKAAKEGLGWHPGAGAGGKYKRMQDMTKLLRTPGELPPPDSFMYRLLEEAAGNLVKEATAFRDMVSARLTDMERAAETDETGADDTEAGVTA